MLPFQTFWSLSCGSAADGDAADLGRQDCSNGSDCQVPGGFHGVAIDGTAALAAGLSSVTLSRQQNQTLEAKKSKSHLRQKLMDGSDVGLISAYKTMEDLNKLPTTHSIF